MKIIEPSFFIAFPFEKYCCFILKAVPKSDIAGIENIKFVESFSDLTLRKRAVACHSNLNRDQKGIIEIHFRNLLIKNIIPVYLFKSHHEIAALLLSEIIYHEVGHHVHKFKRHGIKENESECFADNYAVAGYFNYLQSRKNEILSTFEGASKIRYLHKPVRDSFKRCRRELKKWLDKNKNGIQFP